MAMETVLELADVVKRYGTRGAVCTALDSVSLSVGRGEFVGVMGPSGAGKTTLLNVVATVDRPTSGLVEIDGREVQCMRADELARLRRERLGFIFQDYNLLDTLSLRENIALPLAIANRRPEEIRSRVQALAETLSLRDVLDKFPYEVSGGQKQRAAAARAMVAGPALVLADEPTGALDSQSARVLLSTLAALNARLGVTILMVTHDAVAASYCSRIVFLKDGRLVQRLERGSLSRRAFYDTILDVVAAFGEEAAQ